MVGRPVRSFYYRCVQESPTSLAVGIKFDASHGWNMRQIDCSEYGPITGVWEIGPIISGDRWIPDVLCRSLPQLKGPHPLQLGHGDPEHYQEKWFSVVAPEPEPPNPRHTNTTSITARLLRRSAPPVRGILGRFSTSPATWDSGRFRSSPRSRRRTLHPGYLTLTFPGAGPEGPASARPAAPHLKPLTDYKPPWEIELCFITPGRQHPLEPVDEFRRRGQGRQS